MLFFPTFFVPKMNKFYFSPRPKFHFSLIPKLSTSTKISTKTAKKRPTIGKYAKNKEMPSGLDNKGPNGTAQHAKARIDSKGVLCEVKGL